MVNPTTTAVTTIDMANDARNFITPAPTATPARG